ncbi:MAG: major capsid protein, partial [Rhodoplanes sp.]
LSVPGRRSPARGCGFLDLKYGGITFENYRGWIGGGTDAGDTMTPFIDPNEAHCFPLGTPNLFKTFFGPVDYIEPVSTLGLPCYAKAIPFDNNKSIRLKMQINALTLPAATRSDQAPHH